MKIPQEILDVFAVLEKASPSASGRTGERTGGFKAYLVGGCVRDILLNQKPKDWDITTNAKPEEIGSIFGKSGYKTFYENKFGTVSVVTHSKDETFPPKADQPRAEKTVEITPFRKEAKYSDKRHPDNVSFSVSLEEDLKRRDFTINALALKVKNHEMIDLFGGQKDLKNKIIRAVGKPEERFDEDALRIMRAFRFSAELGFSIEEKTKKALEQKKGLLEMIAKERIRDELIKIFMSPAPDKSLEEMRELGVLKYVLPELEEGFGVTQNKHHIYTVWEHNLKALMHAVQKNWPLDIRLASLFHDLGKPRTKVGEGPDSTFYNHEMVSAKMAGQIFSRLRFSKKFSEKVVKLVRWHLFFSDTEVITLSAVRRIIRNVEPENIWDLMKLRFTDRVGMGRPKERPFRLRKYEAMVEQALRDPISVSMLKINGRDIMEIAGLEPGPKIGYILHALLEEVLDEPKKNNKNYLIQRVKELAALSDNELEKLGKSAKEKKESLEEEEVGKIYQKYWVK